MRLQGSIPRQPDEFGSWNRTSASYSHQNWRSGEGATSGLSPNFFRLIPTLTLLVNVMLSLDFYSLYNPVERKSRAEGLLNQVDLLEHHISFLRSSREVSQQRAAIARALANAPRLLLQTSLQAAWTPRQQIQYLPCFNICRTMVKQSSWLHTTMIWPKAWTERLSWRMEKS